jgi:DNA-binding MarR family transcriptional regulator
MSDKPSHLLGREEQDFVRLSLRLLTAARLIERRVDQLMRARFASTISRFDFMSALDRHGPLTLGAISEHLLVSNGNVTGLSARLRADELIETYQNRDDARVQEVRLTAKGRAAFRKMANAHAACVASLLGAVPADERHALSQILDRTRHSIRQSLSEEDAA